MSKNESTRTKKEVKYPLFKYLELEKPELNKYLRAYIVAEFRGTLKTKKEWEAVVATVLEVKK